MNTKPRFSKTIRSYKEKSLPYAAYLTDNRTGMKFSNTFTTKDEAVRWIDESISILEKTNNKKQYEN